MRALTNGKVLTVSSGSLDSGTALIDDGCLDAGKDADIGVFSEHPFDYRAVAEVILVGGELVYRRSGGLS